MIHRAKTPVATDWWFSLTFRERHFSVMVVTVTKKQSREMDTIMHNGMTLQ